MPTLRTRWLSGRVCLSLQETLVYSWNSWDDLLEEEEMAICSVFLPGKSSGQRSPAGYHCKESARTEHTQIGRRTTHSQKDAASPGATF